jgi:CheY-like chemotaxis protein
MEKKLFTILVAEDDPNDALLIKRAFTKCGIPNPVFIVSDGEEAIAYLSGVGKYSDRLEYPVPDFFITDLKMPRKTGFDVLEWLRGNENYALLPAIVLSSSKQPEDIRRAYTLNANSYFTKPADFAHLQELLKKIYDYWLSCERPEIRRS